MIQPAQRVPPGQERLKHPAEALRDAAEGAGREVFEYLDRLQRLREVGGKIAERLIAGARPRRNAFARTRRSRQAGPPPDDTP
jgi:hypothetical protein